MQLSIKLLPKLTKKGLPSKVCLDLDNCLKAEMDDDELSVLEMYAMMHCITEHEAEQVSILRNNFPELWETVIVKGNLGN